MFTCCSTGDDPEDLVDLVLRQGPAELGGGDHETARELDLIEHRVVAKAVVEWLRHQGAPGSGLCGASRRVAMAEPRPEGVIVVAVFPIGSRLRGQETDGWQTGPAGP